MARWLTPNIPPARAASSAAASAAAAPPRPRRARARAARRREGAGRTLAAAAAPPRPGPRATRTRGRRECAEAADATRRWRRGEAERASAPRARGGGGAAGRPSRTGGPPRPILTCIPWALGEKKSPIRLQWRSSSPEPAFAPRYLLSLASTTRLHLIRHKEKERRACVRPAADRTRGAGARHGATARGETRRRVSASSPGCPRGKRAGSSGRRREVGGRHGRRAARRDAAAALVRVRQPRPGRA